VPFIGSPAPGTHLEDFNSDLLQKNDRVTKKKLGHHIGNEGISQFNKTSQFNQDYENSLFNQEVKQAHGEHYDKHLKREHASFVKKKEESKEEEDEDNEIMMLRDEESGVEVSLIPPRDEPVPFLRNQAPALYADDSDSSLMFSVALTLGGILINNKEATSI
jgi:hypothetical protein